MKFHVNKIPLFNFLVITEFWENWNSNLKRNLPRMAQDVASKTAMKPTDSISWIFSKLQMSIMNQGPNRKSWKSAAKYQLSPMQEGLKWEIWKSER